MFVFYRKISGAVHKLKIVSSAETVQHISERVAVDGKFVVVDIDVVVVIAVVNMIKMIIKKNKNFVVIVIEKKENLIGVINL